MTAFDTHHYKWWPKGATSAKPLTQDFNIDSSDCTLKSLDLAKKLPVSLCFRRSDDDDCFPRTDDDRGPTTDYVTTNFLRFADANLFLESVGIGERALFSVVTELLATDSPRKQSVVISARADRMDTGVDMRSTLLAIVAPVIRAMTSLSTHKPADDAAMFAEYAVSIVSKPILSPESHPHVLVVRNVDERLTNDKEHEHYAKLVAECVAATVALENGSSDFSICSPDAVFVETVNGVSYCAIPVPRWDTSNYPALYLTRERQRVMKELVGGKVKMHRVHDEAISGHFLGAGEVCVCNLASHPGATLTIRFVASAASNRGASFEPVHYAHLHLNARF